MVEIDYCKQLNSFINTCKCWSQRENMAMRVKHKIKLYSFLANKTDTSYDHTTL